MACMSRHSSLAITAELLQAGCIQWLQHGGASAGLVFLSSCDLSYPQLILGVALLRSNICCLPVRWSQTTPLCRSYEAGLASAYLCHGLTWQSA